jgi:hypothetical protein
MTVVYLMGQPQMERQALLRTQVKSGVRPFRGKEGTVRQRGRGSSGIVDRKGQVVEVPASAVAAISGCRSFSSPEQ